jgi:hypothetical protein
VCVEEVLQIELAGSNHHPIDEVSFIEKRALTSNAIEFADFLQEVEQFLGIDVNFHLIAHCDYLNLIS